MSEQVIMFDTTLRDGEQAPGVRFSEEEKVAIADELGQFGVDVIEAGFPENQRDFEAVQAVAQTVGQKIYTVRGVDRTPTICGLARATMQDIDHCWDALQYAADPRIHVFIGTSDCHRKHKFKDMGEDAMVRKVGDAVAHAVSYTTNVEYSPEDATRTGFDFMLRTALAAAEAGATTINIPDTPGVSRPHKYGAMIGRATKEIHALFPDVVVSVHCHDDKGLAIANSIAGVEVGGARQVEGTITGVGERAGNTQLEAVAAIIHEDGAEMGVHTLVDVRRSQIIAALVQQATGYNVPPFYPIVGDNAFAHESGVHVAAVLQDPNTYSALRAEDYGRVIEIVDGKTSGRHGKAFTDAHGEVTDRFQGSRVAPLRTN